MSNFKAIRRSTGQVHYFVTREEAIEFCFRRAEQNQLWHVV